MSQASREIPSILSGKYHGEPSAFTPENLLREARRQKAIIDASVPAVCVARSGCFAHVTNQMARVAGDFEKGEADATIDALAVIRAAADAWRRSKSVTNFGADQG